MRAGLQVAPRAPPRASRLPFVARAHTHMRTMPSTFSKSTAHSARSTAMSCRSGKITSCSATSSTASSGVSSCAVVRPSATACSTWSMLVPSPLLNSPPSTPNSFQSAASA
eukprot:4139641-Prymnesium_polylepis.4